MKYLHESSVVCSYLEDVEVVLGVDVVLHGAVGVGHRHHTRHVLADIE